MFIQIWSVAPAAGAARLLESTPIDGADLEELPQVRLVFDSFLLLDSQTSVTVERDGTIVEYDDLGLDGQDTLTASVSAEILDDLELFGSYEIVWQVRSADGELNQGSIPISIGSQTQQFSGGFIVVLFVFLALGAVVFLAKRRERTPRKP